MTSRTILDLDLRRILTELERRYGVKLPRNVQAVDYGQRGDDLYIRFKHVEKPVGVPTEDGLAVFFYDEGGNQAVSVEILDLTRFMRG